MQEKVLELQKEKSEAKVGFAEEDEVHENLEDDDEEEDEIL